MNALMVTLFKKYYGLLAEMLGRKPNVVDLIWHSVGIVCNYAGYKATITDYFEFALYKKPLLEKRKYLMSTEARRFAELADDVKVLDDYMSKTLMYKDLHKFIKRDQLYTSECTFEEFCDFTSKHQIFLYKPDREDCGKGIEVWSVVGTNQKELYDRAKKYPAVLDEMITQHHSLNELCNKSINTIRIFTLRTDCEIIVIAAALRMGNGTKIVDNYSAGGLVGAINMETGVIIDDAEDARGRRYRNHPYSQKRIKGFSVPNWNIVIEFVQECAKDFKLNYVAWDIAVREDDCVLIEANPSGMIHAIQVAGAGGKRKQYKSLEKLLNSKGIVK